MENFQEFDSNLQRFPLKRVTSQPNQAHNYSSSWQVWCWCVPNNTSFNLQCNHIRVHTRLLLSLCLLCLFCKLCLLRCCSIVNWPLTRMLPGLLRNLQTLGLRRCCLCCLRQSDHHRKSNVIKRITVYIVPHPCMFFATSASLNLPLARQINAVALLAWYQLWDLFCSRFAGLRLRTISRRHRMLTSRLICCATIYSGYVKRLAWTRRADCRFKLKTAMYSSPTVTVW